MICCGCLEIKMFVMKVISQLAKTSTPCVRKEYLMRNSFNSEAFVIKFADMLKTTEVNNCATFNRCYSDKPFVSRVKDSSEEGKKLKESEKKKRDFIPKITLLDQNGNITVTTMQEASKLAQRRNLKLIYLQDDPKSNRSEYKLVSSADYIKSKLESEELDVGLEEKAKTKVTKKQKLAQLSSKIAEHDLNSKLKQVHKWIDKRYEVRIAISIESGDSSAAENVYKIFEKEFKTKSRVRQKLVRPDSLKFVILPPKITDGEGSEEGRETSRIKESSEEGRETLRTKEQTETAAPS